MLLDKDKVIEVEQLNFVKNTKEWSIKTETGVKACKYTFDKRFVLENFETIPFGY
jgi:hypothetical protein